MIITDNYIDNFHVFVLDKQTFKNKTEEKIVTIGDDLGQIIGCEWSNYIIRGVNRDDNIVFLCCANEEQAICNNKELLQKFINSKDINIYKDLFKE